MEKLTIEVFEHQGERIITINGGSPETVAGTVQEKIALLRRITEAQKALSDFVADIAAETIPYGACLRPQ